MPRRSPLELPSPFASARRMIEGAFESPLAAGLDEERQAFFEVFATQDRVEGMRAFVEKRAPRWSGR